LRSYDCVWIGIASERVLRMGQWNRGGTFFSVCGGGAADPDRRFGTLEKAYLIGRFGRAG